MGQSHCTVLSCLNAPCQEKEDQSVEDPCGMPPTQALGLKKPSAISKAMPSADGPNAIAREASGCDSPILSDVETVASKGDNAVVPVVSPPPFVGEEDHDSGLLMAGEDKSSDRRSSRPESRPSGASSITTISASGSDQSPHAVYDSDKCWDSRARGGRYSRRGSGGSRVSSRVESMDLQGVLFQEEEEDSYMVMRMIVASSKGNTDAVRMFVVAGVDVNALGIDKRTALHVAVADGQLDVVRLLVSRGASTECKDRFGRTPQDELSHIRDPAMRDALAEALTADPVDLIPGNFGRMLSKGSTSSTTSLQQNLFAAAAANSLTVVESLLEQRADPNGTDGRGWTAVHVAAGHGHLGVVQLLMAKNADPNVADSSGRKPVALAFANGHDHIVEALGSTVDAEQETFDLQQASEIEGWAIKHSEVKYGRLLGSTNKSTIYMAEWNGAKVVAKTVKARGSETDDGQDSMSSKEYEELLHEIRILSTLRHPDLVLFLGACLEAEPYQIISEYMEGGDLDNYYMVRTRQLGRPFRPKWSQLVRWMSAIARALYFLHTRRSPIIHRDLKPLNIFLTKQLDAKVADFGISKVVSQDEMRNAADGKYMSGGVGTWRYMAPEVVRYEQYKESVDIYSFALIIYFMATGVHPFIEEFGGNAELVLKEYLKGNEPRPSLPSSFGTESLRQLVGACWHPIASERPSAGTCVGSLVEIGTAPHGLISSGLAVVKRVSHSLRA